MHLEKMRFDLLNAFGFVYEGEIMECVADDLCSFCCFVLTNVCFFFLKANCSSASLVDVVVFLRCLFFR